MAPQTVELSNAAAHKPLRNTAFIFSPRMEVKMLRKMYVHTKDFSRSEANLRLVVNRQCLGFWFLYPDRCVFLDGSFDYRRIKAVYLACPIRSTT